MRQSFHLFRRAGVIIVLHIPGSCSHKAIRPIDARLVRSDSAASPLANTAMESSISYVYTVDKQDC